MFFRRNAGKYRETDRVTRFKLIKSGKNWLRAATANFGLFKVVKGIADAPSVSAQSVEEKTPVLSGQALLKGIAAASALAGGAVTTYTAQAEEMTSPALERQLTANQDVTANSDSVVLSTASVSEASVVASTSQESTSSSVDTQASTDASISLSQSVSQSLSAELSQAISESASLSKGYSTSESQSHTESASGSNSESVSESATSTRSATSETATQDDEKTILDQNVSEAELLVNIAKNYQAKLTDTAAKAEIQTAIASVQEEVAKSTTLLAASATNAAYAEQRERLGSAVEGMLTKITNAGFNGNSTVSGSSAIISNLNLAKGETKVYIGSGIDSYYNIPIYYKLTAAHNGKSVTFTYTVTYDNPATATLELPTKLGTNHAIYNTGTSNQTMFTLGSGFGIPSNVANYITDSKGNKVISYNTSTVTKEGNGYSWGNGAQMNGFQAKKGYGLTSSWTVPIIGNDTSFTFTPFAGKTDNNYSNFLSGNKVVESDTTSQSRSLSQSLSIVQSTVVSNSISKSQATSKSVSQSLSTVASESIRKSNETSRSLSTSESSRTSLSQSQSTSQRISQSVSTSSSLSAFNSQSLSSSISQSLSTSASRSASASARISLSQSQSTSQRLSQSASTSASLSTSRLQSL
ncbi:accessory Sec-dependent serine-rich glycoprotein adhesin, partial [Streptococcus salivarius]